MESRDSIKERKESKVLSLVKKGLIFLAKLFGFLKLSDEEKRYLHESNMKSSSYMAFIIIILEIWLIIRQTNKYIKPALAADSSAPFKTIFLYISIFMLFIVISVGVMLFCLFCNREKKLSKARFIGLSISGGLCTLWPILLKFEYFRTGDSIKAVLMNSLLIVIYIATCLMGITILTYAIIKYFKNKNVAVLEHLVIIWFTLTCLAFGIRVSYSDFVGGKEIICFLTMTIYVGCLLIYRPYITLIMLAVSFYGFIALLNTYEESIAFHSGEGDHINYITFLVSLITICFTMYHGRLSEAKKTRVLEKMAKYDNLTDLNNFDYFVDQAKLRISNTDNYLDYVYLFVDIHNFKAYNDKRGFEEGNNFLRTIGDYISEVFAGDLFARQADDHFVVLTEREGLDAKLVALNEKLRASDKEILLSLCSGGYLVVAKNEDPRRCVERARYAARLIKKNFDEIYNEYDKKMDEAYHKVLYIINNIDIAVSEGWIKPFYQPVVWSDDNKLCGCEALARWFDPTYGQLFPGEFIKVLEEYRLIHKLDRSIFEQVCRDLRSSLDANLPVVPVSINFSRLDFELMNPVEELENVVEKYNIPRHLIHIEITESALVDSFDEIKEAMNIFKDKGYSIWLDDFGSGYSSLNVLKYYNFDVIKIDMNFLSNFDTNKKTKTIINSIIQMASNLNMLTLTEGVETKEEADFLKEVGCGRLQGYLFGKPISKEELFSRIKEGSLVVAERIL